MASDIQETPFVKQLAANGTSIEQLYDLRWIKIILLVEVSEVKKVEAW